MTVRVRGGRFMLDVRHTWPDGRRERIRLAVPDDMQSRRGADRFERQILADLARGIDPRGGTEIQPQKQRKTTTLATFVPLFLEGFVATNNRDSTGREKRRAFGRGLLDELGELRLDEIGPRQIEAFKARRKRDGVGNKSINEELAILGKLLDYANEIGELPTAPPKIRRLKVQPPAFDFLDFEEAQRLHAAAASAADPWCAMIPIALLTGLRLGELRGLKWDDVDLVAARLHVRRAADDVGKLAETKSYRARVVDLPKRAVAILKEHKHLRGAFVFCREDGSMLPRHACESKSKEQRDDSPLMKVCRKAGLRRIGWHALRHTYASHLVMRGASMMEVKELLGHASITMTMRYAHLSPSARKAAVGLLDEPTVGHSLGTSKGGGSKNGV